MTDLCQLCDENKCPTCGQCNCHPDPCRCDDDDDDGDDDWLDDEFMEDDEDDEDSSE